MQVKNLMHLDDGMISATVIKEDGSVELTIFDSMEVLHKELERGKQAMGCYSEARNRKMH